MSNEIKLSVQNLPPFRRPQTSCKKLNLSRKEMAFKYSKAKIFFWGGRGKSFLTIHEKKLNVWWGWKVSKPSLMTAINFKEEKKFQNSFLSEFWLEVSFGSSPSSPSNFQLIESEVYWNRIHQNPLFHKLFPSKYSSNIYPATIFSRVEKHQKHQILGRLEEVEMEGFNEGPQFW